MQALQRESGNMKLFTKINLYDEEEHLQREKSVEL